MTWCVGGRQTPLRQCSLSAGIVGGWRMLTSTRAHHPLDTGTAPFDVGARCMTKPMPESSCKMRIVAKTAGVRDFAEMLTGTDRRPAFQKVRGVIQSNRVYQFAAGRAARRQELLEVA